MAIYDGVLRAVGLPVMQDQEACSIVLTYVPGVFETNGNLR